jgi:hypothetical protein
MKRPLIFECIDFFTTHINQIFILKCLMLLIDIVLQSTHHQNIVHLDNVSTLFLELLSS